MLGLLTILMGAFLLFALGFNGINSESLSGFSAHASGYTLIILGLVITLADKKAAKPIFYTAAFTAVLYLPVIYHHFTFISVDAGGLIVDAIYMLVICSIIYKYKPNQALQPTQKPRG